MDFRLHPALFDLLRPRFGELMDLITVPGAAKAFLDGPRDFLLAAIVTSVHLHGTKRVLLVNHTDCGAYGGSAAFPSEAAERERHLNDLGAARRLIEASVQGVAVETMLASLTLEAGGWRVMVP